MDVRRESGALCLKGKLERKLCGESSRGEVDKVVPNISHSLKIIHFLDSLESKDPKVEAEVELLSLSPSELLNNLEEILDFKREGQSIFYHEVPILHGNST